MPFFHASQGDFLEEDWSDGDVVFVNSSCFDYKIMDQIARQVSKLRTERIVPILIMLEMKFVSFCENI